MTNLALYDCAAQLRAIGDQTRLHVVRLLLEEPRHVGALNDELNIEQSLLSHHLRVLRDAGIVEAERHGRHVVYSVSPEVATRRRGPTIDFGCCRVSFTS